MRDERAKRVPNSSSAGADADAPNRRRGWQSRAGTGLAAGRREPGGVAVFVIAPSRQKSAPTAPASNHSPASVAFCAVRSAVRAVDQDREAVCYLSQHAFGLAYWIAELGSVRRARGGGDGVRAGAGAADFG